MKWNRVGISWFVTCVAIVTVEKSQYILGKKAWTCHEQLLRISRKVNDWLFKMYLAKEKQIQMQNYEILIFKKKNSYRHSNS